MPRSSAPNAVVFWPVVVVIVIADYVTKMIALNTLTLFTPQPVAGDALRLTLVRNQGAAFLSSSGGCISRPVRVISRARSRLRSSAPARSAT